MPMSTMNANFGNGSVLLWMLEFFLFVIWFWLLITVFSDLFRDHETSGVAKALWAIFVIVVPYLGVLVYLIARGSGMAERNAKQAQQMQAQMDSRIRAAAGPASGASSAEQITQAKALLDSGAITQAEYDALKSKALST
jgi:hypothetical protein